jgi:hypothetical protein
VKVDLLNVVKLEGSVKWKGNGVGGREVCGGSVFQQESQALRVTFLCGKEQW